MKIEYNIPMINNIKNKFKIVKDKIKNNDKKIPAKYYTLLVLMIVLGFGTLAINVKSYSSSQKENYNEYFVNNTTPISSDKVIVSNQYETAISSVSTNISTIEELEVISSNTNKYIAPVKGGLLKEYADNKLVYSKTLDMWKTHPGVDIKAELDENVLSASDGRVIEITKDSFYGNSVKVLDNYGYLFVYSNLDSLINVGVNQEILKGDIIGKIGVSAMGEVADDCHLHFEVFKENVQINPLDLIDIGE